jgi:tellurite resistance protein
MNNKINEFASIIAVTVLADGEFDAQEESLLAELEQDTELPGLSASIKQVISISNMFSDEQLTDLLYKSAQKFDEDEKPKVFEAAISALLADGVITEDEISNMLTLAEALDIPVEKAVARLLFQVQESESEIVVDVEEDLEDFILVGGKTRYTSWNSFSKMLAEKNYPANLIDTLETIKNWTEATFGAKAEVNYTPNFMTLGCTSPVSRSKTFCFLRMRKNDIRFEFQGKVYDINAANQFVDEIKSSIIEYFNQISKDKI